MLFRSASRLRLMQDGFSNPATTSLHQAFHSSSASLPVSPVLITRGCRASFTCCPSDTHLCLSLGPDFARADQALLWKPWIFSRKGFPPCSLLIPAFSLLGSPHPLPVMLPPLRMLLYQLLRVPQLRCGVSAPDIFGAGSRPVSCYALF